MQPEQDTLTWVRREGAQQPGQGQAVAHMDGVLQPVVAAVRPQLVRLLPFMLANCWWMALSQPLKMKLHKPNLQPRFET